MATSSYNNNKNLREPSDNNGADKEFNRRKEVDDLISKYARKKAPVAPLPVPAPQIPTQNYGLQKDYSSSSLRYAANTSSAHQREPYNSLYGGASSSNLYSSAVRRSSQYDPAAYPEPIYESAAPRQQKYLATSKSSSNLYLQNPYAGGYLDQASLPTRSLNRQQKTLSMHGAPPSSSGRNNNVMETAASIIANAQQQGMGLGQNSDWWNSSNQTSFGQPAPIQHDWSAKNLAWNPPTAASAATSSFGAVGATLGHPAGPPPPAAMPVLMFDPHDLSFLILYPLPEHLCSPILPCDFDMHLSLYSLRYLVWHNFIPIIILNCIDSFRTWLL